MINNIVKEIRPLLKGAVVLIQLTRQKPKEADSDGYTYYLDLLARIVEIKDDLIIVEWYSLPVAEYEGVYTYHRTSITFEEINSIKHYIHNPITFGSFSEEEAKRFNEWPYYSK